MTGKKFDKEIFKMITDEYLFDILRRDSDEMDQVTFLHLMRECLLRLFYSEW